MEGMNAVIFCCFFPAFSHFLFESALIFIFNRVVFLVRFLSSPAFRSRSVVHFRFHFRCYAELFSFWFPLYFSFSYSFGKLPFAVSFAFSFFEFGFGFVTFQVVSFRFVSVPFLFPSLRFRSASRKKRTGETTTCTGWPERRS